jgi:hypothetical protein
LRSSGFFVGDDGSFGSAPPATIVTTVPRARVRFTYSHPSAMRAPALTGRRRRGAYRWRAALCTMPQIARSQLLPHRAERLGWRAECACRLCHATVVNK